MKTLCIIQARMGSSRLPGKILMPLAGKPSLLYQIDRLRRAKTLDKIVVATSTERENDAVARLLEKSGIDCVRGPENDVLARFVEAASKYPDYPWIVRVTGDCPLIDPEVVDEVAKLFAGGDFDYAGNVNPPTFPDGMDVEIFTREALLRADREGKTARDREHVTWYMRKGGKFRLGNLSAVKDFSQVRLTLDTVQDLRVIESLAEALPADATYRDYLKKLNYQI